MTRLRRRLAPCFQGLSPENAALVLVLGLVIGTLPVYGLPTILCALASLALGLNLPAVQIVNQLATPLQLALLVPFVKIGSRLIGAGHVPTWGWNIGALAIQAVAGWFVVSLPLALLLYGLFTWLLRNPSTRQLLQRPAAIQAR